MAATNFRTRFLVCFLFLLNLAFAQTRTHGTGMPDIDMPQMEKLNDNGRITRRQAALWVTILLAIIAISGIFAMYKIDDIEKRDTILYAKFLANLKER